MDLVLIDGDLIVYEAAYCVEAKEKQGEYPNWYQVSKIVNTIVRKILVGSKATHHLGFLTDGKSNFRLKVATTLPYKGQRKTNAEKPRFYDEIRDYLQKHFGFQMMVGVEADDALTIASEHFKDNPKVKTIIATKDKDLWQYAGHHYNMNTKELMVITPEKAHRNLWKQMILGDMATDNIPGLSHANKPSDPKKRAIPCHQFGEARAKKILDENDPEDYAKVIYELYQDMYEEEDDPDYGDYRFHETYQLIFMLLEAPSDLKIHYNPVKVKKADVELDEFDVFPVALEF
jgi:hypothetical protein